MVKNYISDVVWVLQNLEYFICMISFAKGKLCDTNQQPQRSVEIGVRDLIWEIGVGDRQRLNLGDQQR